MKEFLLIVVCLLIVFGFVMLTLFLGKYKQRASSCCGGGKCGSSCTDTQNKTCSKE